MTVYSKVTHHYLRASERKEGNTCAKNVAILLKTKKQLNGFALPLLKMYLPSTTKVVVEAHGYIFILGVVTIK